MCIKFRHGIATILKPVIYPLSISVNTPFEIKYIIKNTGQTDVLWAYLIADGIKLVNSSWSKKIAANSTVTATYKHSGISKDTTIVLRTGY